LNPLSIPPELCTRCKGYKRLCGLPRCPILEAFRAQVGVYLKLRGLSASGSTPPSTLVGEHGYPRVNVYYMMPVEVYGESARIYEDPVTWAGRRLGVSDIIRFRSELLSARLEVPVHEPERLYESEVGLASVSEKPVDSEAELERAPIPNLRFDGITKPLGPRAPARRIRVSGNPKLNPFVEKVIHDDLKALHSVEELYRAGVDVYTIQRLLSLGFLGRRLRRRLVPTRWSITAVDDIISRALRRELRGKPEVQDARVYYNEYLGNRFLVVVKPGPGGFEWIEVWQPRSIWVKEAAEPIVWRVEENALGEATAVDGGFSAARLAVLEALAREGRRADVVIVREITPEYYAPLGNWHIRETVRRAMELKPLAVNPTMGELKSVLGERMEYSPENILSKAKLLAEKRKLTDYI
jgi:hypothetical protein